VLVPWDPDIVTWNSFGPGLILGINVGATSLEPLFTVTVSPGSVVNFSIPATLVQEWINDPSTNDGVLLFSATTVDDLDIAFASTRSTLASGPQLTFNTGASPAPEPGTISVLGSGLAMLFFIHGRRRRTG